MGFTTVELYNRFWEFDIFGQTLLLFYETISTRSDCCVWAGYGS